MKILDPCSATLTLSEVHAFFQNKPPQTPTSKRGAYEPVNVHGYNTVKKDFELYLKRSAPHVPLLPAPETFIAKLLSRFQEENIVLTKVEALTLVNLGVGVKRPAATQTQANGTEEVQESVEIKDEEGEVVETDDRDDYTLLTAVVEEAENRFSDDQLTEILTILREEMPISTEKLVTLAEAFRNGNAEQQDRGVSVPVGKPSPSREAGGVTTEIVEDAEIDDEGFEDDALLHEAGYNIGWWIEVYTLYEEGSLQKLKERRFEFRKSFGSGSPLTTFASPGYTPEDCNDFGYDGFSCSGFEDSDSDSDSIDVGNK